MALFGNRSRNIPREWWERGQDDAIGAMGTTMPMPSKMPDEMPQRAPGFWQGGDKFRARDGIAGLLAVVGDALSRRGGGEGGAVDMLAGTRMSAMEQAQLAQAAQAKRIQELQDYEAKKQVDQRYPNQNDTERDYQLIAERLGPEAAQQYLRNLGDPNVAMTLPGNRFYSGPRSQIGAALSGGGAVAPDDKPTVEDGYQYTPGPGGKGNPANWKPVGGGGGNATGNFPGRYR